MLTSASDGGVRLDRGLRLGRADGAPEAGFPGWLWRMEARHPEWWVLTVAALAWIWMAAAPHAVATDGIRHAGHGAHHGAAAPAGAGIPAVAVMVVAMMLPLTVGGVRHVARSGRWARRHRSIAGFLAGYVGAWMAIMMAIMVAWRVGSSLAGWTAAALAATLIATAWEMAPAAWRQMRRNPRSEPIEQRGWRADAECARSGAGMGLRCVASCWALMAACVAFGHSLPVMAALFGVQLSARYPQKPARVLAALAVLGVCLAAIATRGTGGHPG